MRRRRTRTSDTVGPRRLADDADQTRWTLEIVQGTAGPALVSGSRTAVMLVSGPWSTPGYAELIATRS